MEHFHHGQHVRLRCSELGTYLHADADGRRVSHRHGRESIRSAWAVHIHQGNHPTILLLHSAANGHYLGHPGLRVQQRDYTQLEELEAITWHAVESGFEGRVLIHNFAGGCLRANGRFNRWDKSVSVDDVQNMAMANLSTMMHWVVEQIPARENIPPLPRPSGLDLVPSFIANLPSRTIMYAFVNIVGDPFDANEFLFRGWSVFRLRSRLAVIAGMNVDDLVLCLPTRDGRLFPLLVDLPGGGQEVHVAGITVGSALHAALRCPDVNAA